MARFLLTQSQLPHGQSQLIEHGKMKIHSENPTILNRALPYIGSFTFTAALFLTLPLIQWANEYDLVSDEADPSSFLISAPPAPPPDPPREKEEDEQEEVELKPELKKITLNQIDMALNPGTGGMGASTFNINSFLLADDFGADLIFEIADLDEKPEPIIRITPKYPHKLKRAAIQGRVFVIFIVDENGNVGNARVLESPHPEFSESALAAVQSWKFKPGKKGGKPVKTRVRIPLSFTLRR
jgi:TonB family protein